ncbi:Tyrosine recombinase XerC [subsurface metagenome]
MKNKELVTTKEQGQDNAIAFFEGVQDNYTTDARLYVKFLKQSSLPHSWEAIEKYLDEVNRNCSIPTYNKKVAMIKKRLRTAFDEAYGNNNSEGRYRLEGFLSRLKLGRTADPAVDERKVLTVEEFDKLIAYPDMPTPVKFISLFLWFTGTRISEALSVRLKDIETYKDKVHIKITGKGRKERTVKIKPALFKDIIDYFKSDKLLFEKPNHRPYRREYISVQLLRIGRKVLDRKVSSHRLRHSFATRIYKNHPEALPGLSKYLGHSKVSTTSDLYVHTTLDDEMLGFDK